MLYFSGPLFLEAGFLAIEDNLQALVERPTPPFRLAAECRVYPAKSRAHFQRPVHHTRMKNAVLKNTYAAANPSAPEDLRGVETIALKRPTGWSLFDSSREVCFRAGPPPATARPRSAGPPPPPARDPCRIRRQDDILTL